MLPFLKSRFHHILKRRNGKRKCIDRKKLEAVEEEVISDPPDSLGKGTFHGRGKIGGRTKQAGFIGDS